jgi:hypothetical protein
VIAAWRSASPVERNNFMVLLPTEPQLTAAEAKRMRPSR